MLKTEHSEIYTLDQSSPYRLRGNERSLRQHTLDLRSDAENVNRSLAWFQLISKNKPQQKSILGGLMIFLGASIHIVWGHWRVEVLSSWKERPTPFLLHFTMCSWYLGCICGTIMAAVLISSWTKKQLYYLGTSLLALSGVMFMIWHDTLSALLAGRVLAGFCTGLTFLTLLIHATENIVKELRGYIVSFIGFVRAISTFLATLLFIIPYYNPSPIAHPDDASVTILVTFDVDLLLGIVTFVYAIIALLSIPYLTCESVPFLIRQGRERKALENLIRLRSQPTDTWPVRNEFDELRLMVQEDYAAADKCTSIFGQGNWRPLLAIAALRLMIFMSSNLTLQMIATVFVKIELHNQDYGLQYAMMVLLGTRIGFGMMPMLLSDRWGRKLFLVVSGTLAGLCLGVLGILLLLEDNEVIDLWDWVPSAMFLAFHLFVSLGIDDVGNVLTAEAFPMAKKAWSITFIMVVENVLQCVFLIWIIMVGLDYDNSIWLIFGSGWTIVGLTVGLQRTLPETRGMSLRQCRGEFNKGLTVVAYNGNRNGHFPGEGITYY